MPRSHARIYLTIWSDGDYTNLPMAPQWLYEALCSQPDINQAGVLSLTVRRWAGLCADGSTKIIEAALHVLAARRYVVIDSETEELLVRTFIKNDEVWKSPNTLKNACAAACAARSPKIRETLRDELLKLDMAAIEAMGTPAKHEPVADVVRRTIKVLGDGPITPSDGYDDGNAEPIGDGMGEPPKRARAGAGAGVGVRTTPHVEKNSSFAPREKTRGARIPENFAVTAEMAQWARRECPAVDGRFETAQFVDYWSAKAGKDATKIDWVRTWKTWMRTAQQRAAARTAGQPRPARTLPTDPEAAFAELRDKADARTAARLTGLPFVNDVSPPPDFRGDPYAWEREHRRTWLDQHKSQIIAGLGKGGGA